MTTYDRLRRSLAEPEASTGIVALFVQLAMEHGGMTTAIVTMAALDTSADRAATLIGRKVSEMDALVTLFHAEVSRLLEAERTRRDGDQAA